MAQFAPRGRPHKGRVLSRRARGAFAQLHHWRACAALQGRRRGGQCDFRGQTLPLPRTCRRRARDFPRLGVSRSEAKGLAGDSRRARSPPRPAHLALARHALKGVSSAKRAGDRPSLARVNFGDRPYFERRNLGDRPYWYISKTRALYTKTRALSMTRRGLGAANESVGAELKPYGFGLMLH